MASPFECDDYRDFLRQRLKSMPSNGHGQRTLIAKHLGVHPTLLTQILTRKKNMSLEHGLLVSEYLGLSEIETDYFLASIELERAGHHKLKKRVELKLRNLREKQSKARGRIPRHTVLPESDQATFYSNWFYSAVRLATSVEGLQTIDEIAAGIGLERKLVQEVLVFLERAGLVVHESGLYRMGPQRTYLPPESPLISRHHANWRLKAIERFHRLSEKELAFTAPISLALGDIPKVRKILLNAIEQVSKLVANSNPETVACFNLDLFSVSDSEGI